MKTGIRAFRILALTLFSGIIFMNSCNKNKQDKNEPVDQAVLSEEDLYRPNFHFTPQANWMNDPNGMFFIDGVYHLFFQYYPDGNVWGPMHWGHAISDDMVSWEEKEIALYPDSLGYIFSGSAVVDHQNSSGLGSETEIPVVALYTYHDPIGAEAGKIDFQYQGIAFSTDKGMNWQKFRNNPVLPNPGIRDFRDPKVIWHENSRQWIMVLAADDEAQFYASKDLLNWNYLSSFGKTLGAHGGVWECPDLFPLAVENTDETKWVLLQSLNPGGPNGGSGTQYFIGEFDGEKFVLDPDFEKQLEKQGVVWLDYGRDNYAGVTWSDIPEEDGRRLFIGWMSNWDYAMVVPTEKWRSAMTVARELSLHRKDGRYLIRSFPVRELMQYSELISESGYQSVSPGDIVPGTDKSDMSNTRIDLIINRGEESGFTFSLNNTLGEELLFGYEPGSKSFFIDRSNSGKTGFSEKFSASPSKAPYSGHTDDMELTIILDKTSIELFVDNGELVITEIFFPNQPMDQLKIKEIKGSVEIKSARIFSIRK